MEEIYDIMNEFLSCEEDLNSLIKVLKELDCHYRQSENEEKFEINVVIKCLQMISMDMRKSIEALDVFLATQ